MKLEQFITKFKELRDKSPRLFSTTRDSENCLFTNDMAYSKNCYCVFSGGWAQDCYYGELLIATRDCMDCLKIEKSELCYECVDCYQCYNSNFLVDCGETRDSEYCFNLRGCANCFLSNNQRHKSFIFQNKQCAQEEYFALMHEYKKNHSQEQMYEDFLKLMWCAPRTNLHIINSENCLGNYITDSKNVHYCFDIVHAEDYLYSEEGGYGKDNCDVYFTGEGELIYESVDVSKKSYNCSFCIACTTCVNCEFCMTCYNLNDCFGCVYLKGEKFHILNVPYAEKEYKTEYEFLKKALRERGKYAMGLFFE